MEEFKKQIEQYNQKIIDGEKEGKSFEIVKGKVPIILSAPHCVKQTRNGKIKGEEGETGAIVQYISEYTNCWCIYKTANKQDDANYDIENNPYKEAIIQLVEKNKIKLLIDIHGAGYENDFDIEIGTGRMENLQGKSFIIDELKKDFAENQIKNVTIDTKFKAISEHTISRQISQKAKIPCMQLEINGKYRYIENIEGIKKFTKALMIFINKIKENI